MSDFIRYLERKKSYSGICLVDSLRNSYYKKLNYFLKNEVKSERAAAFASPPDLAKAAFAWSAEHFVMSIICLIFGSETGSALGAAADGVGTAVDVDELDASFFDASNAFSISWRNIFRVGPYIITGDMFYLKKFCLSPVQFLSKNLSPVQFFPNVFP